MAHKEWNGKHEIDQHADIQGCPWYTVKCDKKKSVQKCVELDISIKKRNAKTDTKFQYQLTLRKEAELETHFYFMDSGIIQVFYC